MAQDVYSKTEVIAMLKRAGFSPDTISSLESELDEDVDVRRDETILARHGVTRNTLIDRMGGSP